MTCVSTRLLGIMPHISAVSEGESVEARLQLIHGSNTLSDADKYLWANFLRSFCHFGALEPLQGTVVDLGDGITLRLNKRHEDLQGHELPGVRVDYSGDLVIEGDYFRDGRRCSRKDKVNPRWPLIIRDAPCSGAGPWESFRPQTFFILNHIGASWPL